MRICFVTQLYPPDPGGPATYARALEEGLRSLGHEVALVKFGDVRHLPKVIRHLALARRIREVLKQSDMLFVQDTVSCGVPAVLGSLFLGKPLVVRVPGDYAWEQGRQRFGITNDLDAFQQDRQTLPAKQLHAIQRFVVKRAKCVIVPSQYFKRIVTGWGVTASRLAVIPHGVELPSTLTAPKDRPEGRLIVSAGRFVPWKGFAFLIRLLPDLPEWKLILVGDGPQREHLESLAKAHGVADRVIFTGALPRQESLGWCASADAFVLATLFESFSFQIAEALLLGVPVITTRIGSIPELLEDGKEGVLLSPHDRDGFLRAIRSIGDEPEAWRARTHAAKAKMAGFSEGVMLGATEHALKSVLIAT